MVVDKRNILTIRAAPDTSAQERGRLVRGEPFEVSGVGEGHGCERWGRLDETAWACLDFASPTDREPVALPRILPYEPPQPEDYETYIATGVLPEVAEGAGLLPFVYARRWKTWTGRTWADLAAWERADPSNGRLPAGRRVAFTDVRDTLRGRVFVQEDGSVVPEAEVYVLPITRHSGRDLALNPLPEGARAAWVVGYNGAPGWDEVGRGGGSQRRSEAPVETFAYHVPLVVQEVPGEPRWWQIVSGPESTSPRYVQDLRDVRVWHPAPRPAEIGLDEVWIDVDRSRSMMGVFRGDTPLYVTVVSPGLGSRATPRGVTQIYMKKAWTDMRSRQDALEPYYVEGVPWAIYFRPRYALHGAYWHWGFGHPASHGCVNLSPYDAAWLYAHVLPEATPGWLEVRVLPGAPATWVRVR